MNKLKTRNCNRKTNRQLDKSKINFKLLLKKESVKNKTIKMI